MIKRRGMAIGLVFAVLIVLFVGGMTLSQLMRGVQRQLEFSDAQIRCQYIGEAGMNLLLTRLLARPWEQRWFQAGPDSASAIPYGDGNYDYFIMDTASKPYYVDLWIRTTFKTAKRCFFWRVKFDHGLLGGLAQGIAVNRFELEPDQAPPTGTTFTTPFTEQIAQIITERNSKKNGSNQLVSNIRQVVPTNQILTTIGKQNPGRVQNSPFTVETPTSVSPPLILASLTLPVLSLSPVPSIFRPGTKKVEKKFKEWLKENKIDSALLTSLTGIFNSGFAEYVKLVGEKKFDEAMKKLTQTLTKINDDFGGEETRMGDDDDQEGEDFDWDDLLDFGDENKRNKKKDGKTKKSGH